MLSAYELELEEADDRLLSSRICFNAASRGSPSGSPHTLTEVEEVDPVRIRAGCRRNGLPTGGLDGR